jgi:hypothetical protein
MYPKGQAFTHILHPTHNVLLTTTAPVTRSLKMAPEGQISRQEAVSHCWQVMVKMILSFISI